MRLSDHAIARWMERADASTDRLTEVKRLARQVELAVRHGRLAKRKPSWAVFVERRKDPDKWFAWNQDETLAFVLAKPRLSDILSPEMRKKAMSAPSRWLVVTVVPRQDAANTDAMKLARAQYEDRMRRLKDGNWTPGGKTKTGYRRKRPGR